MDERPVWDRVRALQGHTLSTLSGRGRFDVVEVTDDRLQVRVHDAKKPGLLPVDRGHVELVASNNWQPEELVARTAETVPDRGVKSYIAAIVHAISGPNQH